MVVITLARKPVTEGTVRNVREHRTGALNIDACRIAATPWTIQNGATGSGFNKDKFMGYVGAGENTQVNLLRAGSTAGRWP